MHKWQNHKNKFFSLSTLPIFSMHDFCVHRLRLHRDSGNIFAFTQTKTLGCKKFSRLSHEMSRFTINCSLCFPYMKMNGCALNQMMKKKKKKQTPICGGQNMEFIVLSKTGNLLEYFSTVIKCWINLWVTHNSYKRVQHSRERIFTAMSYVVKQNKSHRNFL